MHQDPDTVDFCFKKVEKSQKEKLVGSVFNTVASKYDLMNDMMSLGIHRLWKRFTMELTGIRRGHKVLDLAGGTGDFSSKIAPVVGSDGLVVLCDINASMLSVGRDRLLDEGSVQNTQFVLANGEYLPFQENTFDCILIGFGLRNMTDKNQALSSMYRVLKPGGRLIVLEFSKPYSQNLTKLYDLYSFHILPKIGKLVANDEDSYRYLVESIRMHPDQETLKSMMEKVGFRRCEYYNLTGGIVAVHRGFKF